MTMRVTVAVGGIVDPKWGAKDLGLGEDGTGVRRAVPRILSPFDEAAIESALKLRDAHPGTRLRFLVASEGEDLALARSAMAFRPDEVLSLALAEPLLWDPQAASDLLAQATASEGEPADLVLLGREFGDFDEGMVAPLLAEALGCPFAGLVQEVGCDAEGLFFVRDAGEVRQRLRAARTPVVASVTNSQWNRLRYPLMKNVMAAKRERPQAIGCAADAARAARRAASLAARVPKPRTESPCVILQGSGAEQARQFIHTVRQLLASDA